MINNATIRRLPSGHYEYALNIAGRILRLWSADTIEAGKQQFREWIKSALGEAYRPGMLIRFTYQTW